MTSFTKREQIVILVFVVVIVGILGYNILNDDAPKIINEKQPVLVSNDDTNLDKDNTKNIENDSIMVHISGQVFNEGVVKLPTNSRLKDAIEKLGGLKGDADIRGINLAKVLSDEDRIHVPKIGEEVSINTYEYHSNSSNDTGKININIASKDELTSLPGIGDVIADRIIEHRKGSRFNSIEDIQNVDGIGEKKFASIKELVTVK